MRANTFRFSSTVSRNGNATYGDVKFIFSRISPRCVAIDLPKMLMRPEVGVIKPEDHVNRRGLARPVGPEHPDDLAALDPEAHVVDGVKVVEGLAQIFHFYQHRITCL